MAHLLTSRTSSQATKLVSLVALLIFLPLLLLAAYQTAVLISRAVGTPADIVVDVKAVLEPIKTDFYHAFSQSGNGTNVLAPVVAKVRALGPRIIRIDHIFDGYGVVSGGSGNLSFDWGRLDEVVESIRSTGARPMLVLSYMPPAIAQGGSVIAPPNNWGDWATVVQKTIEHYSGRAEKNISGVLYECWNEPELAQFGGWKLGGDKNYLTLYQNCSLGASRANNINAFSLGGPATANLNKGWILSTLGAGRVNFLSWHTYNHNPKQFDEDERNLVSWLLPYPNAVLIPKFITEFGPTGDKSTLYASSYAAAHAAAVIRQLISGGPTYLFSFQLRDTSSGGNDWGLLTSDGSPKPRYWVYNFIDSMAGDRLAATGEGTWVTALATTKNSIIRVLLVNFDASGAHTENVPVAFINLDDGRYSYRERFLFGRDVTFTETVTGGKLEKLILMPSQTVAMLELKKQ
ncbi:hypothetical protein HY086_05560 [Candidatus Gottesmanbacteria bacterium]|nr:hypothetical protein [Candidatus Gottesmanbacteria bacterium]